MNMVNRPRSALIILTSILAVPVALGYPLDSYEETAIRRVEGARLANLGQAVGGFQPPGAMLLGHFGPAYPVSEEQIRTFFSTTPGGELTRAFSTDVLGTGDPQRSAAGPDPAG